MKKCPFVTHLVSSTRKFHTFALALLLAVILAGCGGGSSSSDPAPVAPDPALLSAQEMARAAADAAKIAADAAGEAHMAAIAAAALIPSDEATAQLRMDADAQMAADDANAAYMTAMAASGAAMATDDVAAAQTELATANAARDTAVAEQANAMAAQMAAENAQAAVVSTIVAHHALVTARDSARPRISVAKMAAETAQMGADGHSGEATMYENKAMAARTNYKDASEAAMNAAKAATDAADAVAMAEQAERDLDAATTIAEVVAAQMKAENAQAAAEQAKDNAMMYEEDAMAAASEHVYGLFMAANKDGMSVKQVATIAKTAAMTPENSTRIVYDSPRRDASGELMRHPFADGMPTVVRVTYDVDSSDDKTGATIPAKRKFALKAGFGLSSLHIDEMDFEVDMGKAPMATHTELPPLGGDGEFMGYELVKKTDEGTTLHAHVYTDIEQSQKVKAQTFLAVPVTDSGMISEAEPPTNDNMAQGTTFTGKYDQDGAGTMYEPVSGTFTCIEKDGCDYAKTDGKVTVAIGYEFWRNAINAVTKVDTDYLAFGVWVLQNANGNYTRIGTFGARRLYTESGETGRLRVSQLRVLEGKATYTGPATGLYTSGESVDFFNATAALEADFGDAPEVGVGNQNGDIGSISGNISNIVAGGESMDMDITLQKPR